MHYVYCRSQDGKPMSTSTILSRGVYIIPKILAINASKSPNIVKFFFLSSVYSLRVMHRIGNMVITWLNNGYVWQRFALHWNRVIVCKLMYIRIYARQNHGWCEHIIFHGWSQMPNFFSGRYVRTTRWLDKINLVLVTMRR